MKYLIFLPVLLAYFTGMAQSVAPNKTPEDFARTVFFSLKTKNFDLYETTVPTYLEVKKFTESIKGTPEYTEEIHNNKKARRLKWFLKTISDAEKSNLNLTESNYCGFKGKIDTLNNLIGIYNGYICFESDSKKYNIVADKVWLINNEWKSIENLLGIETPPIEKEIDKELAEFLAGPKLEIQGSGVTVSADNFSKGIPFATTINTASDKKYYSEAELVQLNKPTYVIGKPIQIGKILVAQNEFPKKMTWASAKLACQKLGAGWRLPTKDELYILYQNKNKLKNFSKYGYWSSTEGNMDGVVWYQDFYLGSTKPSLANKLSTWGVRAVKSL